MVEFKIRKSWDLAGFPIEFMDPPEYIASYFFIRHCKELASGTGKKMFRLLGDFPMTPSNLEPDFTDFSPFWIKALGPVWPNRVYWTNPERFSQASEALEDALLGDVG